MYAKNAFFSQIALARILSLFTCRYLSPYVPVRRVPPLSREEADVKTRRQKPEGSMPSDRVSRSAYSRDPN